MNVVCLLDCVIQMAVGGWLGKGSVVANVCTLVTALIKRFVA